MSLVLTIEVRTRCAPVDIRGPAPIMAVFAALLQRGTTTDAAMCKKLEGAFGAVHDPADLGAPRRALSAAGHCMRGSTGAVRAGGSERTRAFAAAAPTPAPVLSAVECGIAQLLAGRDDLPDDPVLRRTVLSVPPPLPPF